METPEGRQACIHGELFQEPGIHTHPRWIYDENLFSLQKCREEERLRNWVAPGELGKCCGWAFIGEEVGNIVPCLWAPAPQHEHDRLDRLCGLIR